MTRIPYRIRPTVPASPLILALIVAACSGTVANEQAGTADLSQSPSLPAVVSLAAGTSAELPSAKIRIRFDSISADSRCPTDVQCVQAGSATAHLRIEYTDILPAIYMTNESVTLSTVPGRDTVTSFWQPLRLLGVQPAPVSTKRIAPSEYRISLRVGADK